MHFCTCVVAITEDTGNTVHRSEHNPVSWPEVEVITALHGPSSVNHVVPFVTVRQTPSRERDRLVGIYGPVVVQQVDQHPAIYPGRNPNMTMEAPDFTVRPGLRWFNPLSDQMEEVGPDGFSTETPAEEFIPVSPAVEPAEPTVVGDLPPSFLAAQKTSGRRRSTPESQKANYDADSPDSSF